MLVIHEGPIAKSLARLKELGRAPARHGPGLERVHQHHRDAPAPETPTEVEHVPVGRLERLVARGSALIVVPRPRETENHQTPSGLWSRGHRVARRHAGHEGHVGLEEDDGLVFSGRHRCARRRRGVMCVGRGFARRRSGRGRRRVMFVLPESRGCEQEAERCRREACRDHRYGPFRKAIAGRADCGPSIPRGPGSRGGGSSGARREERVPVGDRRPSPTRREPHASGRKRQRRAPPGHRSLVLPTWPGPPTRSRERRPRRDRGRTGSGPARAWSAPRGADARHSEEHAQHPRYARDRELHRTRARRGAGRPEPRRPSGRARPPSPA